MGAQQSTFPYDIGEKNAQFEGKTIWSLHKGTRKEDGKEVSIFVFDKQKNRQYLPVATNAFKRLRTIRHPGILTYIDGVDLEPTFIYIVTEAVSPLTDEDLVGNAASWGLHQVITATHFLHTTCKLIHGNLVMNSLFVSKTGDWKVGGFDLLSDPKDDSSILKTHYELLPERYRPPELARGGWSAIQRAPIHAVDTWLIGCLIYEIFNGHFSAAEDLKHIGNIPKKLVPQYQEIFSGSPKSRITLPRLLDSPYFANPYVETCLFIENFQIKDSNEKDIFFKKLPKMIDEFPQPFCKYKVLPHLINAVDFGGPAGHKILASLFKISSYLTADEFNSQLLPNIAKWFASNDRAFRINLLQSLPSFANHLPSSLVNDQIFPVIVNGFTDSAPTLRELTLKSMLLLAPKLSEKTIDTQLLKYFARLQLDPEPGIRTNTTICLGKIASSLSDATRKRVLIAAFTRAMRDPFIPARIAGINSLRATQSYYSLDDCAKRIVPALSVLTVDPSKQVRTASLQALSLYFSKLQQASEALPDDQPATSAAAPSNGPSTPATSAAASGMLGWAVSSISKKIYGTATATAASSPPAATPPNANSVPPTGAAQTSPHEPIKPTAVKKGSLWQEDMGRDGQEENGEEKRSGNGWDDWNDDIDAEDLERELASTGGKTFNAASVELSSGWDDNEGGWASLDDDKPPKLPPKKAPSSSTTIPAAKAGEAANVAASASTAGAAGSALQLGAQTTSAARPPQTTPPAPKQPSKPASKTATSLEGWDDDYDSTDWGDAPAKPSLVATATNTTKTPQTAPAKPKADSGWNDDDDWADFGMAANTASSGKTATAEGGKGMKLTRLEREKKKKEEKERIRQPK